ncbi:type II secretion system F family protein [Helicobacter ibis]|uniref:Type II secretion system F family protein n=1 Tax=Helicobacter ibis TaxID=2962633 RepID=A0ABT4VEY2_9HELI|nr:type II secretion system F family protein [Helicobacter ibis]MDA3969240.1 type II secretion system F family protein [Helicobacter ibis]
MIFYITYKKDGKLKSKKIKCDSFEALDITLSKEQIKPIKIETKESIFNRFIKLKPSTKEMINMFYHIKLGLKAKLPFNKILSDTLDGTKNKKLQLQIQRILLGLNAGKSLHMCFVEAKFSDFICSMIDIGEKSGNLLSSLEFIILDLKNKAKNTKLLKKAISYPAFVCVVMACVFLAITIFVLPQFESLFLSIKGDLPFASVSLLFMRFLVLEYGILIAVIFIIIYIIIKIFYQKSCFVRERLSYLSLKLPYFGAVFYYYESVKFFLSFYWTYKSKVKLEAALSISIQSLNNEYLKSKLNSVYISVNKGFSLQESLLKLNIWDSLTKQLLKSSKDEDGFIESIELILELHKDELESKAESLLSIIEPFMIFVLGLLVLWLALGVFLPLWELPSQIQI